MSSAITFSGFNNIDFNLILNSLMAQERVPLTAMETQKQTLKTQSTAFATLATKLGAVEAAAEALQDENAFGGRAVTTTDQTRVSATVDTTAPAGIYDVVVRELARGQVTASASTHTESAIVATGGTLTIGGVAVTLTGDTTLQGLADAINGTANIGVTASVVSPSSGNYQLVLTGKDTGAAAAFTITNALTATTLAFTDTDTDGISGDSAADNAMSAVDADILVNNVAVLSATNVVEDVVPGASLTLLKKDPATTVTVSVSNSDETTKSLVETFVSAYNDLLTFVQQQSSSSTGIGRNSLTRQLRNELRSLISNEYAVGGSYETLSAVGVGFDRTGKLTFDSTMFSDALTDAADDVRHLFAGNGGTDGVFDAMTAAIDTYTQAGALIANTRERLDDQIAALDSRLLAMEERLAIRRSALQKEFIAADQVISQLNSQAGSLSSLGSQYSLF